MGSVDMWRLVAFCLSLRPTSHHDNDAFNRSPRQASPLPEILATASAAGSGVTAEPVASIVIGGDATATFVILSIVIAVIHCVLMIKRPTVRASPTTTNPARLNSKNPSM